jgi:SAM-dependent methyltransferase
MSTKLRAMLAMVRPREFALARRTCPFCGPALIARLRDDEISVRCLRCGASAVHLSLGHVLGGRDLSTLVACELSARGPLVRFLRSRVRLLATSEFFEGVEHGALFNGVRCEDVHELTYPDASFDLITHTEVFEHVPDDARGFAELRRVLKPGGSMVFTVPIDPRASTVERAILRNGRIEHLHLPVYHGDPLRGGSRILVYREYGGDIIERLRTAGFDDASILPASPHVPWNRGRCVITACVR